MKPVVPAATIILPFAVVGPPVGAFVFLWVLGFPAGLAAGANLLPFIRAAYPVGLLPALGAGAIAILVSPRPIWLRVLLPVIGIGNGAQFLAHVLVLMDWNAFGPKLTPAFLLGGAAGGLTAVVALEVWRHRRTHRPARPAQGREVRETGSQD